MLAISGLLSAALLVMGLNAQEIVKDMSFGYDRTISPNSFGIPGWSKLGEGHVPQLLSDKVILTPPYGGNKRGALWAEKQNNLQQWAVDYEFRAGGQDRGLGNLVLWYVKDGQSQVSTSSIYTVGKFDGLALLVDTIGGVQKIRGFLNDGGVDYQSHPNVDSLAFGHCDYNYRNLGRPSKLRLTSSESGLEVTIDGKSCFSSSQINLPHDYTFGMTASSADPPDSFETFKFLLSPTTPSFHSPQQPPQQQQQQNQNNFAPRSQSDSNTPASQITTSQAQFEDLNSRLYTLHKSLTNQYADLQRLSLELSTRHNELLTRLPPQNLDSKLDQLDSRLQSLERDLKSTSGDHGAKFQRLEQQIAQSHSFAQDMPNTIREYVQDHTPRIGFIVFSFMAFQSALVVAYVVYKRRRMNMPKKFL